MLRRTLLKGLCISAAGLPILASAAASPAPTIDVYKTESCGCCKEWVRHLEQNGFAVKARNVASPAEYREKFGIPQQFGSCHTGFVQGYALEGHVPAAEIKRMLAERPKAIGLAVPSMPMGSPGMEGSRSDPFDVILVQAGGRHVVYQHYAAK